MAENGASGSPVENELRALVQLAYDLADRLSGCSSQVLDFTAGSGSWMRLPSAESGLRVDDRTGRAWLNGQELDLGPEEFALARAFVRHPGALLGYEMLIREIWHGDDAFGRVARQVHYQVYKLRSRIEAAGGDKAMIVSVPRRGYRYEPCTSRS